MRLGLLGYPVAHSLSPKLYNELLGQNMTSYDLYACPSPSEIPLLNDFGSKLDGLNITSPYKEHFFHDVQILSPLVKAMGAINTISFTEDGYFGTNTDILAVEEILQNYLKTSKKLHLIILGAGVMAKITLLVAQKLNIPVTQLSRQTHPDLSTLDLTDYRQANLENIFINACSRDFVFSGKISLEDIFWDYNYSFLPHQNTLPSLVKSYQDGQEMLRLQAKAAVLFWKETNPKLK